MPNLREVAPVIREENGLIRIEWTATGCDGMTVTLTGEQDALTPYVATALYLQLGKAITEFQHSNDGAPKKIRTG